MLTPSDTVLFIFSKSCDCKDYPQEAIQMTIYNILESGTPMCSECEEEFILSDTCEVQA